MLHIYYGRESLDKEKFIFDMIRQKRAGGLDAGGRGLLHRNALPPAPL